MPNTLSAADIQAVANVTHGYVGADLAALVREAAVCAIKRVHSKDTIKARVSDARSSDQLSEMLNSSGNDVDVNPGDIGLPGSEKSSEPTSCTPTPKLPSANHLELTKSPNSSYSPSTHTTPYGNSYSQRINFSFATSPIPASPVRSQKQREQTAVSDRAAARLVQSVDKLHISSNTSPGAKHTETTSSTPSPHDILLESSRMNSAIGVSMVDLRKAMALVRPSAMREVVLDIPKVSEFP